MYKTLNGQTPQYLHEIIDEMFTSRRCQYPLRNSNGKLFIPKPNPDYLKRSFSYSGAFLWSNLPDDTNELFSVYEISMVRPPVITLAVSLKRQGGKSSSPVDFLRFEFFKFLKTLLVLDLYLFSFLN